MSQKEEEILGASGTELEEGKHHTPDLELRQPRDARVAPSPRHVPSVSSSSPIQEEGHITKFLTLSNPRHQAEYIDFAMKETNAVISVTLIVFTYFIYMSHSVVQLAYPSRVNLFLAIARHCRTATLIPVLMYVYCIAQRRIPRLPKHPLSVVLLGNIIISTHSLCAGLIILSRSLIGGCEENKLGCNPAAQNNSIPLDAFMFCAYSMIALPVLVKCHTWVVVFLSNVCISLLFLSALSHVNADGNTFISAVLFSFSIVVTLYECERYSMQTFMGHKNMLAAVEKKNIAEAEMEIIANHSKELRFMIGNVAHDLKTPVQAMVSEIEVLEDHASSKEEVTVSASSLRNSCTFMMMMINRSLDYMKSTSGLVLVPRMETVSLSESLSWVVDCVGKKKGVPIIVEEASPEVHNFVITDKQWLLENLLCLVSNSVKFVSRGSINIRMYLNLRDQETCNESSYRDEKESNYSRKEEHGSFMAFALPPYKNNEDSCLDTFEKNDIMLHIEVEDTGRFLFCA